MTDLAFGLLRLVAWSSAAVYVVCGASGLAQLQRGSRRSALWMLLFATVGGFVFSLIGGFSVGRVTSALPLLVTCIAVTFSQPPLWQAFALTGGLFMYLLLAWVLPGMVSSLPLPVALLLGFWGIPIELLTCVALYAIVLHWGTP